MLPNWHKIGGYDRKNPENIFIKKNHTDILLRAKDSNNFHLRKFLQPLVKHVYVPKIIYFETFPWILSFLIYFLFLVLLCVCVCVC